MALCMSPKFMEEDNDRYLKIRNSAERYFTNDLVFDLMINLMNIDAGKYVNEENDILNDKYNNDRNRFKTSYGKREIKDK